MIDLGKYDVKGAAEKGAELHLKHPATLEPLMDRKKPVFIRVLGRDSETVQAARKEANRLLAEEAIDEEERGLRIVVAAVVGWSDALGMDGKKLPYTPENARKLLTDERTSWIVEQVFPFLMARRNYAANMPKG